VQALVENNGVPLSGQTVTWQNPTSGIATPSPASVTTNSAGIAAQTLTVGPLAEGQTASISACLNGASQCVAFTAFGARHEYAALEAISGTSQNLAASGTPNQIALRFWTWTATPWPAARWRSTSAYAWTRLARPTWSAHRERCWRPNNPRHLAIDGSVTFCARVAVRRGDESQRPRRFGNTSTVSVRSSRIREAEKGNQEPDAAEDAVRRALLGFA